jgi:hypothetical protein
MTDYPPTELVLPDNSSPDQPPIPAIGSYFILTVSASELDIYVNEELNEPGQIVKCIAHDRLPWSENQDTPRHDLPYCPRFQFLHYDDHYVTQDDDWTIYHMSDWEPIGKPKTATRAHL